MLLSKDAVADVIETVRGVDFYIPKHELIFDAILGLYSHGEPTDVIAVTDELTKSGELTRAGGAEYLHTLTGLVPTAANAGFYSSIVAEKAVLRRLVEAGTRIVQMGYASEGEVTDLVNNAQAEIYGVTGGVESEDYVPLIEAINTATDEIEAAAGRDGAMVGVPTGFAELDALTNGLHPGQLIILAARPAIGKSTLALDFARAAAVHHDMPTIVFSLEMGRSEIAMRLLSAEASIPLQNMRKGTIHQQDWSTLASVRGKIADAPLYIDDSPNMTLVEIRAKCRRLKQKVGLKMVVIDYLQLMTSGKKVESRQQEVSEFSRALKLLAKEIGVPVIAISQLNRGPEQRADKKPALSDLRESGSLEQDADMVILLHRESAYEKDSPRAGEADLIIAKHRNGPTDTITVGFHGHFSRFVDLPPGS
jgi:replicative DNA helicase